MQTRELASQLEIRDLAARFTDAVNRRAPKDLADLFTEDGEWHVPGLSAAVGPEAIRQQLAGLLSNFDRLVQLTHTGYVDLDGPIARATWYISEAGTDGAGNGFTVTGVYTDSLVHTEDGWRFSRRDFDFLHRGKAEQTGRWYAHPRTASE